MRQIEERLQCKYWQDTGYVFTTAVGTPIDGRNLSRQFTAILETKNLRKIRFHDLRHCYATLQLANGTPARVVMEALGHSRIDTTLDVYTSVLESVNREAADRLGAMFGSPDVALRG